MYLHISSSVLVRHCLENLLVLRRYIRYLDKNDRQSMIFKNKLAMALIRRQKNTNVRIREIGWLYHITQIYPEIRLVQGYIFIDRIKCMKSVCTQSFYQKKSGV